MTTFIRVKIEPFVSSIEKCATLIFGLSCDGIYKINLLELYSDKIIHNICQLCNSILNYCLECIIIGL